MEDLRLRAKAKLPAPMFHYIDGGSDDEWTLRRNSEAFNEYQLVPRYLRNVATIDTSTKILGSDLKLPFILSPTGMSRLFHHEKELAVAKAAEKFGTMYSLSTMGTTSLEEISQTILSPKMFQIYILRDRGLTREFVQRCKEAKFDALCLTVDTLVAGNRERDLVNGMTMPPKITLPNLLSYGLSFEWLFHLALNPDFKLANVEHRVDALGTGAMGLIEYVNSQFDRSLTWADAEWLSSQWAGPFVIKGLQSPEDVVKAKEIGATAVMISNHGGRQLDTTPAPVDCVKAIKERLGDSIELIVDGGIRRGTHILKCLALGADAVSIGRPYLYGLAAGGQQGVERAIQLLCDELERDMMLLGVSSITDLKPEHIKRINS